MSDNANDILATMTLEGKQLQWLQDRGISKETADLYHIKNGETDNTIIFPFLDADGTKLIYAKKRNLDYTETGAPKEIPLIKGQGCFFGLQHCRTDTKNIIITEGQMDTLALAEAGVRELGYDVISVPAGCKSLSFVGEEDIQFLQSYDNVIVFGDKEDNNKITLADFFADNVNAGNIRTIRIADYGNDKDANDILLHKGREHLINAVKGAEKYASKNIVQAMQIPALNDLYLTLFLTGWPQTDMMIGGIEAGNLILLMGDAGTGKSTMAALLALKARKAEIKSFIYSGEMSTSETLACMLRQAAGKKNMMAYEHYKTKSIRYIVPSREANAIKKWINDYIFFYEDKDDTDITDKEYISDSVIRAAEQQVKYNGVRFVILDNMMTMLDLYSDADLYAAQGKLVRRLNKLAKTYNCAVLLLVHPRKSNGNYRLTMDSISGSSIVKNKSDVILCYERRMPQEGDDEKEDLPSGYLRVLKNRRWGMRTPANEHGEALYYGAASRRIMAYDEFSDAKRGLEYQYKWTISIIDEEGKNE